ncbi:MAG TPA: hypothetical protein PLR06_09245 [Cyclobacteriaceae bacterium]|nr:hypothetical protein [Cyclobacteriaceae bacterium]
MAKETNLPPWALFIGGSLFIAGGWLMASFPAFILIGLAPLFALTDRATSIASVWEKMEWVLLSLVVFFLSSHSFDFNFIVSSLAYAILFTLPFAGYVWVRQTLGSRAGKISIVLFWLALEYLLLKLFPASSTYLADALRLEPSWVRWNIHTGYLGSSLWILITNYMIYQAFLSIQPFRWHWILLAVIFIASPVVYSYSLDISCLTREDMLNLYSGNSMTNNVMYLARGEFVVRTAAWISTLILLFTLVKSQTTQR